jgi:predicted SAM-dependent methyltransferase
VFLWRDDLEASSTFDLEAAEFRDIQVINTNEIQRPNEDMAPEQKPMYRVDLGCGDNKPEGWIGVDICETPSADKVHDLTQAPWPFEDNSVDEARCSHFFEHLSPVERIVFMNELWRVLKPGAGCTFITPRGYERQVQDPTHKWPPVVSATYLYFSKEWLEINKLSHYREMLNIVADFEVRPMQISVTPEFAVRSDEHKLFAVQHYANAAVDLIVLVVKKA